MQYQPRFSLKQVRYLFSAILLGDLLLTAGVVTSS
jgi:hypothetical protein